MGGLVDARTRAALSGGSVDETVRRIGRATRGQDVEFGAWVSPLSGQIRGMSRGSATSSFISSPTKSKRRLAQLAERSSNPEVQGRAMSAVQGAYGKTGMRGPTPVMVHNHPVTGGVNRGMPSSTDVMGMVGSSGGRPFDWRVVSPTRQRVFAGTPGGEITQVGTKPATRVVRIRSAGGTSAGDPRTMDAMARVVGADLGERLPAATMDAPVPPIMLRAQGLGARDGWMLPTGSDARAMMAAGVEADPTGPATRGFMATRAGRRYDDETLSALRGSRRFRVDEQMMKRADPFEIEKMAGMGALKGMLQSAGQAATTRGTRMIQDTPRKMQRMRRRVDGMSTGGKLALGAGTGGAAGLAVGGMSKAAALPPGSSRAARAAGKSRKVRRVVRDAAGVVRTAGRRAKDAALGGPRRAFVEETSDVMRLPNGRVGVVDGYRVGYRRPGNRVIKPSERAQEFSSGGTKMSGVRRMGGGVRGGPSAEQARQGAQIAGVTAGGTAAVVAPPAVIGTAWDRKIERDKKRGPVKKNDPFQVEKKVTFEGGQLHYYPKKKKYGSGKEKAGTAAATVGGATVAGVAGEAVGARAGGSTRRNVREAFERTQARANRVGMAGDEAAAARIWDSQRRLMRHPAFRRAWVGGVVGMGTGGVAGYKAAKAIRARKRKAVAKAADPFQVSKGTDRPSQFKAAVWNRDLVGTGPRASRNQRIQQREAQKRVPKALAVGAGLGAAGGMVAGRALGPKVGMGAARSVLTGGAGGAYLGGLEGMMTGAHTAGLQAQRDPRYKEAPKRKRKKRT